MKYFVLSTTEGCATNLLENSSYRRQYEGQGFLPASEAKDADVILINTCGYNQEMENKATSVISELRDKYPGKEIVLAGCLPKINPRKIKSDFAGLEVKKLPVDQQASQSFQFDRDDFGSLSAKHRLVLLMRPFYYRFERAVGFHLRPLHNLFKSVIVNEEFFLITVSTGCLGKCTFCAIKRAKGTLRSRPLNTLVSEFEAGLSAGKKKFWLLGDDVGCWGQDLNLSLVDLLKAFVGRSDDFELVINYLDPQFLVRYVDELQEIFNDPRIIGMNAPLQSGSDRVLENMARVYEAKPVYRALKSFKSFNPGLAIKTNIIVGFPGESWQDFLKSLFAVFQFDAILALKFTPRPQTPAASYGDQIPEWIKNLRMAIMNTAILGRHLYVVLSSFFRLEKV
jgi:threonylcarbamoyladenosine tRNA methylthiotransferase CDKAL1